jgi:hypothetical protein
MVQPQYSPQEALERVKLMMKYDTSKTLNENREIIFEQDYATGTAIGTGVGAGTAAAIAGTAAATNVATTTALGSATYSAMGLGSTLAPAAGVTAASALGAAVIGGAAALALTPLIVWYMDKDDAKPKVERMVQYCTSDAAKIQKIKRGLGDGEIRNLSDQLYDAMEGVGTDEDSVYGAFKSLKTVSDFCALVTRFNKDYGSEGDLLEWLDDDFDQTSEWMQIFRPLRDIVEDTLLAIKDDETPVPEDEKVKEKTGGYTPCKPNQYVYGCKTDVTGAVGQVQECLGLVVDGKFGPKTRAALKAKGVKSFTDADVEKICIKTQEQPNDTENPYADYVDDEIETGTADNTGTPNNTDEPIEQ